MTYEDLRPTSIPGMRGPHARALISPQLVPTLDCPLLVELKAGSRCERAWLYREDFSLSDGRTATRTSLDARLSADEIGLSDRARDELGAHDTNQAIDLRVPAHGVLRVLAANADDLPPDAQVQVADAFSDHLRTGFRRRWALVTSRGIAAPVRVAVRPDIPPDGVRMSMLLRTLLDARSGASVQLAALPQPTASDRRRAAAARVRQRGQRRRRFSRWTLLLGRTVRALRVVDLAVEGLLRVTLRSPTLTLVTGQTLPGDDEGGLVRLHPAALSALGIASGHQVVVRWGPISGVAVAYEDYVPYHPGPLPALARVQRVETLTQAAGDSVPPHLFARVSPELRRDLGMPATSVVEIRRRIRPLVLAHLNQLAVPVGGLVLAGAAVPALRGWPLVAGGVVAVVFGLANLRMPRPPRGRWP